MKEVEAARLEVGGQDQQLKSTLNGFRKEADQYLAEAQTLKARNGSLAEMESRAMKLHEFNEAPLELEPEYTVTKAWLDKLTEARDNPERIQGSTEFKIGIATIKFEATRKGRGAWRRVKAACAGSEEIKG